MSDLESGATRSAQSLIALITIALQRNVVVDRDCGMAGERLFTLYDGLGDVGREAV